MGEGGAQAKGLKGKAAKKARKAAAKALAEKGAAGDAACVDEDARKAAQREIQKLVVRLRSEGKSEAEINQAKKELKAGLGDFHTTESRRQKKVEAWQEQTKEYFKTEKAKEERHKHLEVKHQLVVIPVVWRGRHDKLDIMKAAEDVKACVAQQGVDCWIDSRRQLTPGQKFAHWEFRGVMLRVEIGPEDFAKGICCVAKAKEAGDYKSVEKKRVRLPPAGARALLLTLKEFGGIGGIDIERREGDSSDEEPEDGEGKEVFEFTGAKRKGADAAAPAKAKGPATGDDLEGNWEPRVDPRAAKEGTTKKRKLKKKRRR